MELQAHLSTKYIKLEPRILKPLAEKNFQDENFILENIIRFQYNKYPNTFWSSPWNDLSKSAAWEETRSFSCLSKNQYYNIFLVQPKQEINLLILDSQKAIEAAYKKYPFPTEVFNDPKLNLFLSQKPCLNLLKIKQDFNGVLLTKRGLVENEIVLQKECFNSPNFQGWDCESTM